MKILEKAFDWINIKFLPQTKNDENIPVNLIGKKEFLI